MSVLTRHLWPSRLLTFALAFLLAASVAYWVLRWPQPALLQPVVAEASAAPVPDAQALARVLGAGGALAQQTTVAESGRYSLTGVLAGPGPRGAALISIDGKPARSYRVGALVDASLYLQSVQGRRAVLATGSAEGAPSLTLEMKPLVR